MMMIRLGWEIKTTMGTIFVATINFYRHFNLNFRKFIDLDSVFIISYMTII